MKLLILRSEKSEKSEENEPLDDCYVQRFNTRYADRVIGNLYGAPTFCSACVADCIQCRKPYKRSFGREIVDIITFPSVLPHVIENPWQYVPDDVTAHNVMLVIAIHEQILLEFLKLCKHWGTKGVVVPIEEPDWISNSARNQARALCEARGIEIAFPKPFCSFKPPEGSVLARFRQRFHIGHPEVELTVKDGRIRKANAKVSGPCGSTYYIARWLLGRRIEEDLVTDVISKRLHSYPCTASMERDPELNDDTCLHVACHAHNTILARSGEAPGRPDDMVMSPLGRKVYRASSPAENIWNIERAKAFVLDKLKRCPTVTFEQLCRTRTVTPAAITTAVVLLKKEGKIRPQDLRAR